MRRASSSWLPLAEFMSALGLSAPTSGKLSQNKADSDFALMVNLPPCVEIHPVWSVVVLPATSHTSHVNITEPKGHGDGGFHKLSLLEVGHSSDFVNHG